MDDPRPSPRHPLGSHARVLLTSVFGPYACDDEHGSRAINPMELYHNQVTRVQGAFSLRMFHRSWGLMLIQANLEAPCTLLDFPSLERFVDELVRVPYDVVLVEMQDEKGVRFIANIDCPSDQIQFDMPVQVDFIDITDSQPLPIFRKAAR